MPDLTLCTNEDCQFTEYCYRYKATPSNYVQSYCRFEPGNDNCERFIPINEETNQNYLIKASELL
jgi:hypothetical protein